MSNPFTYDVFLSYQTADKLSVLELANRLKTAGLNVWFDDFVIKPGDDILLGIERGIQNTRTLVLCMSSNAFSSDWVDLERSTVIFRDPTNKSRRFIPLLLESCAIPDVVRRYRYIDYRTRSDSALAELVAACKPDGVWPISNDSSSPSDPKIARHLNKLTSARQNEWKRVRSDFETEARRYHDVKLSTIYLGDGKPDSKEAFPQPNHLINLWQYYGNMNAADPINRFTDQKLTNWGMTGCKLSVMALITGQQTELFRRMAERAGSLLPDEVSSILIGDLVKNFSKYFGDGKPMLVTNGNSLAKWINLLLTVTRSAYPERLKNHTLATDPFAASLTVFDYLSLD